MGKAHHNATAGEVASGAGTAAGTVRALLAAAGLAVPDDEIDRLAQLYLGLRRSVDRYYRVEVGDEVAASVFRAQESAPGAEP